MKAKHIITALYRRAVVALDVLAEEGRTGKREPQGGTVVGSICRDAAGNVYYSPTAKPPHTWTLTFDAGLDDLEERLFRIMDRGDERPQA